MKVLVLGGKRYVGKRAVAQLLTDGAQVTLLSRGIDANPFGIKVSRKDCLEWVNIQFILGMKYATSVLDGKAWVPTQRV